MSSGDKKPQSDPEGLSVTKLLELVMGVSAHADREVARITGIYKLVAVCLTAIIAFGIYFTYKDAAEVRRSTQEQMKEFKESSARDIVAQKERLKEEAMEQQKQMRDRQELLFSQMQARLDHRVSGLSQQVKTKVDEEFKTEKITKLVNDKAQERIDKIADPLITTKITNQIQPKIEEADKSVWTLKGEIQTARGSLQKVEDTAAFLDVVTAAQNDDRQAFDKLRFWSNDPNFDRHVEAAKYWWSIVDAHNEMFPNDYSNFIYWEEWAKESKVSDPSKLSFEDLHRLYYDDPVATFEFRAGILQHIYNRKDFSKRQKLGLLIEAMKKDRSLKVVAEASRLFQIESKQNKKRLLVDYMYEWWEKNKDTISDKPESATQGSK